MNKPISLAKQVNAAIAAHGCHMQQDESLIDHIVEHADEIRGSAVPAFNEAINKLNEEHAKAIAAKDLKIQELTEALAKECASHTDAKQVTASTAEERDAARRAHLKTVDDSDAGREHLTEGTADEAEPTEDETEQGDKDPVDADPKAPTVKLAKAPAKKAAAKGKTPAKKK